VAGKKGSKKKLKSAKKLSKTVTLDKASPKLF